MKIQVNGEEQIIIKLTSTQPNAGDANDILEYYSIYTGPA